MKVEVKKVDAGKRQLTIEVAGDVVKTKFEEVFKKITREAKLPGFRPGAAPRDMIEKHFSTQAQEQVVKELIPDVYNKAIEEQKLDVVALPEIADVKIDRANLSFKATVEISPEIKLKNYLGVKVEFKPVEVPPDEVKRSIDALKEQRKAETIDEGFARSLGYPDVAELEKAVGHQLFLQKENAQRQKIEHEVIEAVLKDVEFPLPSSMVERQLEESLRRAKVDLALRGIPREKVDEQETLLRTELEKEARSHVKMYLVFSEIAKKENIPQDEHLVQHVLEFLLRKADWKQA